MKRQSQTQGRPSLFRALGPNDVPLRIHVAGKEFVHERTIKHDSWAATALYRLEIPHVNPNGKPAFRGADKVTQIICKFNRVQPILFLPSAWLGRSLAKREAMMYERLADLSNVTAGYRDVYVDGKLQPHAVAHDFISGHPLRWHDQVDDQFFEEIYELLVKIHARNIAYVDLHKLENIIVDDHGRPNLIDFQISICLPKIWPLSWVLRIFQRADLYHLSKHARRFRPDLYSSFHFGRRPWWIRLHRMVAIPFRTLRRQLLVLLGVRDKSGKARTEKFIEEGLRHCGQGGSPIETLYRFFISDAYARRAAADGQDRIVAMFADLIGREPSPGEEACLVKRLQRIELHEQVVAILTSKLVKIHTKGWNSAYLQFVSNNVANKLDQFAQLSKSA
ncbi:MAG TPA: hypothetical protein PKD64_14440 [Pirellulaceae bacterium]|nr:hypothetical protein [Pirellulaceae bacterium]HMO93380.1 hypothetical protein [Pirellulaceae bacterium]HMP70440.1 hypothetical protein [Pirellulaceae bacterium]